MKKLFTMAALLGVFTALQVSAMTVNESRTVGYYLLPGGEFTIQSVAPDPVFNNLYDNYAAVATLNGGFQTFCINTSIGVQGNPLDATVDPAGIAKGTGLLYSLFASGNLAGYDYTAGAGREVSAYALQNAIWALQGQHVYSQTAADIFLTSGQFTSVFADLAAAKVLDVAPYGVGQLLMNKIIGSPTGANGTAVIPSQPMLVLVPDGGMTLMLLGFALTGLGLINRKIRN